MYSDDVLETIIGMGILIIVFLLIILIAYLVFYVIGLWKLFEKSGEQGWKAIIPFYNTYTLIKVAGLNWYWFLLYLISTILTIFGVTEGLLSTLGSIVSFVAGINIWYNLSKTFDKGTGWFVLSVFFSGFTIPILGLSKNDVYKGTSDVSPNGFFSSLLDSNNGGQSASNQNNQAQQSNQNVANQMTVDNGNVNQTSVDNSQDINNVQ